MADVLELLIVPVGRHLVALGGVVGVDVAQGALEGVVARRTRGDVDLKVAAHGMVELLPLAFVGPAIVPGGTLAGEAVTILLPQHPFRVLVPSDRHCFLGEGVLREQKRAAQKAQ